MKTRDQINQYMAQNHIRRYHRLKQKLIVLLGGQCTQCRETMDLQFDHIDPKTKKFTITDYLLRLPWSEILKEIKKCQLLCRKHHDVKTLVDKGQIAAKGTHGTLSAYRYCKCEKCRSAKAKWMREYHARRP